MGRIKRIIGGIFLALILLLGGGFYYVNKEAIGIPAFDIWELFSQADHGGQYADINGVRIYYETFGEGPPVLVLHGGTAFIETMHYQITALAGDHFVIAPDSRGHGRSSDGDGPLHYAQMADDMIALLDRLHVDKADIVGWSDGGIIALNLAMRYPDRVGRIAISGANFDTEGLVDVPDPNADPESDEVAGQRYFYKRLAPDPDHWPVFYRKVLTMWASEPHYTLTELSTIKAPVLVMAGEFDSVKRAHTDALAAAIPNAEEVIIKGASHFAPVEKSDEVNAHIAAFFGG
jgi:pimeloyl-ACP methyl ester carboxylesterase